MNFFKNRKILVGVIAILVIGFIAIGYTKNNGYEEIKEDEILATNETDNKKENDDEKIKTIVIHIAGEVKTPGVVKVPEGSRIEDVVKSSGGLTEKADITNVNLAYIVTDGIKIRIPSIDDELEKEQYILNGAGDGVIVSENKNNLDQVININKATQIEFETLPGIGPSLASKIIEYRNKNGNFKSISDIKKVEGIGDSKYNNIKEYIKVK